MLEREARRRARRIVLVTSLLGGGGAERTLVTMAEWWAERGEDVTIFVLRKAGAVSDYAISAGITVTRLGLIEEHNPWWDARQPLQLFRLRQALLAARPDVVISFIDKLNVAVLLALWGSAVPVVTTEHLVPWRHPLGLFWETGRRFIYRQATAIVSPTGAITDWFAARMRGVFVTLPYPASVEPAEDPWKDRKPVIIAVGRLVKLKGFDVLIDAFAKIASRFPGWMLEVGGSGPEGDALARQLARLGLTERVTLLGHVSDVPERLGRASIFVLSSRHEAYPMALCEAMAAGCCVIATDCPTGPREILGGEDIGLIVPSDDVDLMAEALVRTIQDEPLRETFARRAHARASMLGPKGVMPGWDAHLEEWAKRTR